MVRIRLFTTQFRCRSPAASRRRRRPTRPNLTSSSSSPVAWGVAVNQRKFKFINNQVHRLWKNYLTFHDMNILILDENYKKMGGESKLKYYGSINDEFKGVDSAGGMGFSVAAIAMKQIPPSDWSPEDDGIEIILGCEKKVPSSKEDVDAYINKLLYGINYNVNRNPRKKRLPVFQSICMT